MPQPTVFISYSHKDEKEKEALLSHLSVLGHVGLIDVWNDDRIGAGGDWEKEITEAMARASVAILLVSANFLTSNFILRKEVPTLLERRESEGLTVFPIIAKACAWKVVPWLTRMNVRPKNGAPVWGDGGVHVDEDLAAIAEEVADIIKSKLRSQLKAAKDPTQIVEFSQHILNLAPDDPEAKRAREGARRQLDIAAYRKEAKGAFDEAEYEKAIAAWEKLLALDPEDEAAKTELGAAEKQKQIRDETARALSAVIQEDYQTALDAWNSILALAPDDAQAQAGVKEAQRQLDIRACRQRAKDAFAKRRYDDAMAQWKELLELAPDDEEAKTGVARIQNLLELRRHLRELEGAVAAGKDEEAVRSWKRISPLLVEDVLSTYDKRIVSLTQDVEGRDQEIERLKSEIQRLRRQNSRRHRRS